MLAGSVNSGADGKDSYGAMLDWSQPGSFSFSGQRRRRKGSMDLYTVVYRLEQGNR
jgi:TolB protein